MNPPTFLSPKNRAAFLLGFLGIMTLPAGELIGQQPAQPPVAQPPQTAAPDSEKAPASPWERRHAGEVVFEAPFPVEDGPDALRGAPERLRNTLISVKTFRAGDPKRGFQISVTNIVYKPGVPVDLEAAIKGVTSKLAELIGDKNQKFMTEPAKISGLEARHSEFHGTARDGRPLYASLAVVQQGEKLWEVEAISMNEAVVPDLARLMASIAIEPAP